ncbi:hypothetical protein F2P56_031146 [Juglans regia]|uniref:Uncharacterized protein LOC109007267 n=2 Tax=Juglans regia TaxID=51240 RepID=A0A2I4GEV8_JUGRE|nr:uncharacterized protein LOC109007267 [Juglans regia]XP_018842421.2 uncharacterized protein LOC109007267 [Juglans regia]KAF5450827.1 hypothetical protein F2P56_031146 [Juglans regia]
MEKEDSTEKSVVNSPTAEKVEEELLVQEEDREEPLKERRDSPKFGHDSLQDESGDKRDEGMNFQAKAQEQKLDVDIGQVDSGNKMNESRDLGDKMNKNRDLESQAQEDDKDQNMEGVFGEENEEEPVFDGTEGVVEKAVALTNFVKEKGAVAVSSVLRRLSGKKDEDGQDFPGDESKDVPNSSENSDVKEVPQKTTERSAWNPLSYIMMSHDADADNKAEQREEVSKGSTQPIAMKGRVILYTRLGCLDCKEARLFLYWKRLRYVEINIDIYPSRKLELEKISGSSAVPKVFFNEILIGGVSELKASNESGKLDEKIDYLINEAPSFEAPLPPLSGEDDLSSSGAIDELALLVQKMKESIIVKDRFYKMRRFTNCFIGSEAVDFLSEDQYLEREEAIEFGRKLASTFFFHHVLEENLFEDGNHLYRFLDDDPIVSSQCHNIPRGITDVKPKPILDIASRLRFLFYGILEAYTSEDGKHVDYRSIHGSEEFARYLRIVQELQRVEVQDMPREEKLAFFINLYNMMAIHAILVLGHPAGPLERRKLLGDFKYVVSGSTFSLSAIQNGILRGNQRPPFNLMKPFGAKDKRSKVALPYPEPLIHFALVCGTRSGPALRCYSPGNIDKELMDAARNFLRNGGIIVDMNAKVASASKILKWFNVDFGKNEVEVLKHASNYLEPADSEALLDLLANSQLKVIYQQYDWSLNC